MPAVAAMLGIGAAWASEPRGRLRPAALLVGELAVVVYYAERLLFGTPGCGGSRSPARSARSLRAALARWPARAEPRCARCCAAAPCSR